MAAPNVFSVTYGLIWTRAMYRVQTRRVWVLRCHSETAGILNPAFNRLPDQPSSNATS